MTYSIVAREGSTGQIGVAVQSHFLGVGRLVAWAEAGVGAVATQSVVEPAFGPRGLDALRAGDPAGAVVSALIAGDEQAGVRQLAVVDASGRVAAHTGERCIAAAGHRQGEGVSAQGDELAARGDTDAALREHAAAHAAEPGNMELAFWHGAALAAEGREDEARPLIARAAAAHAGWGELLRRLPASGLFPDDRGLIERLLAPAGDG